MGYVHIVRDVPLLTSLRAVGVQIRYPEMQKAFKKFMNMDDDKGGMATFDQFIEIFNAEPTGETKKVTGLLGGTLCVCVCCRRDGGRAALPPSPQLYDLYEVADAQALNLREVMLGLNNFTGATPAQRVSASA